MARTPPNKVANPDSLISRGSPVSRESLAYLGSVTCRMRNDSIGHNKTAATAPAMIDAMTNANAVLSFNKAEKMGLATSYTPNYENQC